ncbi:MAG: site-2 protease family protein [Deltaproteobacteria bacterium]|jgi:Zn-dependent protease|nr:site-2 protease family protein [Deltaproteobacteria bacterium]
MLGFSSDSIKRALILVPLLLLAVTFHECAHGWMANRKGDPTAKNLGRLSLNPLVHLDLLGTLVMLVTGFIGWAKPVPVNPRNMRDPARDMISVALAGPIANLILAIIFLGILKAVIFIGDNWAGYRAVPYFVLVAQVCLTAVLLNLGLAFFNLLPVPPLDGFRVVSYFMAPAAVEFCQRFYIFFLVGLLLLIRFGVLDAVFYTIKKTVFYLFL